MWPVRGKCTTESTSIVGVPGIYLWIRDIIASEYLAATIQRRHWNTPVHHRHEPQGTFLMWQSC